MRLPSHVLATLTLVICVLINCAFWGGVATSKTLGPVVPDALRLQAPLAYTWLLLGETSGRALGLGESMAAFAEAQIDDPARVIEDRALAAERVLAGRSGWLKPLHSMPLLLLPLAAYLWWRRPRGLKTFGGKR